MATTIDTRPAAVTGSATPAPTSKAAEASGGADRFLKLLVAQMKNQDPLNPMDNAEVTSQMAQISTVSGIEKVNQNLTAMTSTFSAMQTLQGAALVGRGVLVPGSLLPLDEKGRTGGGFDLESPADKVKVEILSTSGAVLDTVDVGATDAGRVSFEWALKNGINAEKVGSFRVVATNGGVAVPAQPLMRDTVRSVVTGGSQLMLELANSGSVPYTQIKAFN